LSVEYCYERFIEEMKTIFKSAIILFMVTLPHTNFQVSAEESQVRRDPIIQPNHSQSTEEKVPKGKPDQRSKDKTDGDLRGNAHGNSKQPRPRSNLGIQRERPMGYEIKSSDKSNRSFEKSMRSLDNSLRRMNTDINKIRTLDRRF